MLKDFFNPHNLGGDCLAIEEDLRLGTPTAVFGVSDAYKALLAAACTTGRVVYVTDSAPNAARMAAEIAAFAGEEVALLCAKDEVLLYKEAVSKDALFRRLTALRKVRKGTRLVVADVESLLQLFPDDVPRDRFAGGGGGRLCRPSASLSRAGLCPCGHGGERGHVRPARRHSGYFPRRRGKPRARRFFRRHGGEDQTV